MQKKAKGCPRHALMVILDLVQQSTAQDKGYKEAIDISQALIRKHPLTYTPHQTPDVITYIMNMNELSNINRLLIMSNKPIVSHTQILLKRLFL